MDAIRLIHRILGETMLLIALAGVILAIVGLVRKQQLDKTERIFGAAYGGLLDLQALLGLVQFIWLLSKTGASLLTSRLVFHPVLMILAVVTVHISRAWRNNPPPLRHKAQLAAYGLSLVLIFAGRMILA